VSLGNVEDAADLSFGALVLETQPQDFMDLPMDDVLLVKQPTRESSKLPQLFPCPWPLSFNFKLSSLSGISVQFAVESVSSLVRKTQPGAVFRNSMATLPAISSTD